ncbi:MAG: hypothetical protein HQ539_02710 [Parcubacteria group bacterium]|nr:hypothetical protein [Parcubacteria group bacterium]
MSSIEILALILALFILVKLITISFSPKKWIGFSRAILKSSPLVYIIYLALTVLVGWIVLSKFSIVEVGAITLFVSLLISLSFLPYAKKLIVLSEDLMNGVIKKSWLVILIWTVLAVWIIYAVLT